MSVKRLLLRSNSYAAAEGWDDLVHAFTESLKDSSLDEMVLLLHTTVSVPHEERSGYIRPVSYSKLDSVPRLLSTTPSALRASTTPAHHQELKPIDDIPQERIIDRKEGETVASGGDHGEEIDETVANAAKVIQTAYRLHLKRTSVIPEGIDAAQAQYWHLLRKRSTEMGLPINSRYYLLFRIPLAYILVCLDMIGAFAGSKKKEADKRMKTAGHRELEELMEARKKCRCEPAKRRPQY